MIHRFGSKSHPLTDLGQKSKMNTYRYRYNTIVIELKTKWFIFYGYCGHRGTVRTGERVPTVYLSIISAVVHFWTNFNRQRRVGRYKLYRTRIHGPFWREKIRGFLRIHPRFHGYAELYTHHVSVFGWGHCKLSHLILRLNISMVVV
jgi:hypothetical protein